jgi:hypothetical protein
MASATSSSDIARFMQANQQTLIQSRGAVNKFRPTEAALGQYYSKIIDGNVEIVDGKIYDSQNKDTGQTQKQCQVQFKIVHICAADVEVPAEHKEVYSGLQAYLTYNLVPGKQESWDRLSADLEVMGVPTRNMVPTPEQVTMQGQFTLEQAVKAIAAKGSFCLTAVTAGRSAGSKYTNYRDAVRQEDIERWMGHPINPAIFNQVPEPQQQMQMGNQIPQQQMGQMPQQQMGMPMAPQSMPAPMQMPGVNPYQQQMPQGVPQQMIPQQPSEPVYPQSGANFAGNPALLQAQPDGTYFDPHSKNFYNQYGQFVPVTPPLPLPPGGTPTSSMGMPTPLGGMPQQLSMPGQPQPGLPQQLTMPGQPVPGQPQQLTMPPVGGMPPQGMPAGMPGMPMQMGYGMPGMPQQQVPF